MKTRIKSGLPDPQTQTHEALYELIVNKQISVMHLINVCKMLCATKIISILRLEHGVGIRSIPTKVRNKWGRVVVFNLYELEDRQSAIETYKKLTSGK